MLINTIVCSSTLKTPIKRYIKQLEVVFKRTTSKNILLRKEITKARELLQVRREYKKEKQVAIKEKFVFNT